MNKCLKSKVIVTIKQKNYSYSNECEKKTLLGPAPIQMVPLPPDLFTPKFYDGESLPAAPFNVRIVF